MKNTNFGIEIEMTGLTRENAANVAVALLGGSVSHRSAYDAWVVTAPDGRVWKFVSDSSIREERKDGGYADGKYQTEFVSPILTYERDMDTLQELVRQLRKNGALTNNSCGIHVHLDGEPHNARSIRNFINIIASKNDLFYKALQIEADRFRWCKKMDGTLVEKMNSAKPTTLRQIEDIWYGVLGGNANRYEHYNQSRYHFFYG